jgi:hypothetical protein
MVCASIGLNICLYSYTKSSLVASSRYKLISLGRLELSIPIKSRELLKATLGSLNGSYLTSIG